MLVEVRSGRWQEQRQFQLLECSSDTGIGELKRQALAAAAADGSGSGGGAAQPASSCQLPHELTFLGQTCEDGKRLRDYGVSHDWIAQVTGFVLRPAAAAETC